MRLGLGQNTKLDSIEIRWSNGEKETIKNIAADKFYRINQGKGMEK